jgi:hypothetical protein
VSIIEEQAQDGDSFCKHGKEHTVSIKRCEVLE